MKNKAIELLVRMQYNIKDEDQVDVKFLYLIGNLYTFEVRDYSEHDGHTTLRITIIEIKSFSHIIDLD